MSNDSRYWALRIANVALFFVTSWLLGKAIMAGFEPGSKSTALWVVFFVIALAVNIPVYVLYRRAKSMRWQQVDRKSQAQLEVETLAAYARMQQAEAEKKRDQTHD